jgi:phosphoribosylanthranilate isomerase
MAETEQRPTTRVKICGITCAEDAEAAIAAGADYLGFVMVRRSPRYVTADQVAAIVRGLSTPTVCVGVFADAPAPEISEILDECGLDMAQLCGREQGGDAELLGVGRVWKACCLRSWADVMAATAFPCDAVVVDSARGGQLGGTGLVADWDLARGLGRQRRVVLAGGLNPENVGEAVCRVRPWAVDVSSGVERFPGRKSVEKIGAFVAAVRGADRVALHRQAARDDGTGDAVTEELGVDS